MSRADRTRGGTQITPIWRRTRSTGETVGAAPNGGSSAPTAVDADPELRMPILPSSPATLG